MENDELLKVIVTYLQGQPGGSAALKELGPYITKKKLVCSTPAPKFKKLIATRPDIFLVEDGIVCLAGIAAEGKEETMELKRREIDARKEEQKAKKAEEKARRKGTAAMENDELLKVIVTYLQKQPAGSAALKELGPYITKKKLARSTPAPKLNKLIATRPDIFLVKDGIVCLSGITAEGKEETMELKRREIDARKEEQKAKKAEEKARRKGTAAMENDELLKVIVTYLQGQPGVTYLQKQPAGSAALKELGPYITKKKLARSTPAPKLKKLIATRPDIFLVKDGIVCLSGITAEGKEETMELKRREIDASNEEQKAKKAEEEASKKGRADMENDELLKVIVNYLQEQPGGSAAVKELGPYI
eukprot:TRINITY_DN10426_c0_g1_i5.p2 TRINITY_DN10426_c0_g1~~TRINITY_DN10426_c0_g1_i5.p2  ORF type:complete len:400 (+),score=104.18 TRINITY_DN10426_c0_g1_i5:117-1202(+)